MKNPYYAVTVPVFIKMLTNLDNLLTKGLAMATEKGMTEEALLATRLAPDMFPLSQQIQVATDNAKGCVSRLAGVENPVMADTETTVAELQARIAKTIAFLQSVPAEQFDGAHEQKVSLKWFEGKHFTAQDYLTEYALPNFFFHATTAYAIMRHLGFEIGKADFTGALTLHND